MHSVAFEMASIEEVLEARPIQSNRELLLFQVPSRNVVWKDLIVPISRRGSGRYLGENFNKLTLQADGDQDIDGKVASQVLVCHDLKGNYREDRHYSSSRKWDDYRFYHWSGVDYFCYFSHNYITIPPSGWTNAAHKHGVVMLGTIIVEGGNCHLINEILHTRKQIDDTVDALARLCDHFCFEGYLLNIECSIMRSLVSNLHYFIETLTKRIHAMIPHGTVIFYDSLMSTGSLHHQNELNHHNRIFLDMCDGILINYQWSDQHLQTTANTIKDFYPNQQNKVFMGVDVFGRSLPAQLETYKLLQQIVPYGFSVGLFAIGWTFESLKHRYNLDDLEGVIQLNEDFLKNNDSFWHLLWPFLNTKPYTETPFFTNFCLGSGRYQYSYGQRTDEKFFNLSKQTLQPSVPLWGICERSFTEGLNGGSCLSIKKNNEAIRLFSTEFHVSNSFIFAYAFKVADVNAKVDCILEFSSERNPLRKFQLVCGTRRYFEQDSRQIQIAAIELPTQTYKVAQYLTQSFTQLKIPFSLSNGWQAHYYIACFNRPIVVSDIGVIVRTTKETDAYLGAVHFHASNVDVGDFAVIHFE